MSVWNKIGTSTWTKINSIFTKTSGSWTEIIGVWVKTSSNVWTRVFTRLSLAANTVPPAITGSTKLYGTLTGSIGTWTAPNGTNSYARQWQSAANVNDAPGSFGTTQTSGQTSSTYTTTDAVDGRWVRVRVVATNLSGDSTAFSDPVLITKFKPVALIIPAISGTPAVDITLTALTTVGTYWKNTTTNTGDTAPDSFTYRWYWGDTGDNIGSNSPTYTVVEADLGHTIRVDVTAKNTGGETTSTSNQTATVGQPIGISDVVFEDLNGDSGFNNRDNLVTATGLKLKWKVSGVNSSTTFRVRYRVLNNQTGAYWNPDSETATTASAAWITYESNYNNVGNISNVTISGGDALIYDVFSIPEIFNGSTFSGGIARWTWEYDISAVIGGNRYYWVTGDTVSRSFTYDWWDIDPTTNPTISPSSANRTTSTSVTFTGTLASYPASLNAYTRAYKMVYGDGTDSGWFYPNSGASNTTYSFTKTYSTEGTYYPYITAIPYYASASSTITVFDPKTRTLSFDANGGTGAPSSQTGTDNGSGAVITITATKPTRTGYSFSKWNTNSSGTGTDYNPSGSITLTSDVTLYAVWTEAATAPSSPTSVSISSATLTKDFSTSLSRVSNTAKDQYWYGSVRADRTISWTNGTGASSHEILYKTSSTTPLSTASAGYSGITDTSRGDYWTYGSSAITYYYWVRARNANGVSDWVYAGAFPVPALSPSSFSIRLFRGNGTSSSAPSNPPAYSAGFYGWTGIISRGNPNANPPGEGSYATATVTLNGGTALSATSGLA
jgi:uncharacterized repeat protein (TIGR02543 family)